MDELYKMDKNCEFKYFGKFQCKNKNQYEQVKQEFV